MAHSPYKTPRLLFISALSVLGVVLILFVYFLINIMLINQRKEVVVQGEKGIQGAGKAYVCLGYYEICEFYLVTTDKKDQQALLNKQIDSLWVQVQKSIKLYRAHNALNYPSLDSLEATLKKYRKNSEQIKALVSQNNNQQALDDLMGGNHRILLKRLEEHFQDIIELLPDYTENLLKPEKRAYIGSSISMNRLGQFFLIASIVLLFTIQLAFEKIYRPMLFKRLLPIIILGNLFILITIWSKPAQRYGAKHAIVKDYARFINFMTYFNHYTTLECRHVLDTSRLKKKQLEEEMAVFRRSMRQALRDSKKKFGGKFKKDVNKLYKLRSEYFSKTVVPSMVYSFQQDRLRSLFLLLPVQTQPDSLVDLVPPDEVSYVQGQNAAATKKMHSIFNKVLQGLDQYYKTAPSKLYSKNQYFEAYIVVFVIWFILYGLTFWRFFKRKKWIVYKAKEHFLLKKQLN